MKKLLTVLVCALTAFACVCCFSACDNETDSEVVNLKALSAADQVGIMDTVDYYVVAEPLASARVKAIKELEFAGDMQKLYGSENGYPQAVVVAKNEIVSTSFMGELIAALNQTEEWLESESTSIDTIVNAISANLTEGASPTLSSGNLTKTVIKNCAVNYVSAADSKADIISFMQEVNSVSETPFGTPSDNFFWDGQVSTAECGAVSVYAPDGAPALGIANLLAGEAEFSCKVNYEVVNANNINVYVNGDNPKADICVLPVNAAVKLLGSGAKYKLVGTLTHGNLYIVSKNGEQITAENIQSLRGKTVGVVNLAAVPGLTLKIILNKYGIEYTELV